MKILTTTMVTMAMLALTGCMTGGDSSKNDLSSQARNAAESKKDYQANLAKWEAAKVGDYSYQVSMDCFCFPMGWMNIEVEDGVVVKVDSVEGQAVLFEPDQAGLSPTVDHLFQTIGSHVGNPDYTVNVEYDKALGYPARIEIRNQAFLRDADYDIRVVELKPR